MRWDCGGRIVRLGNLIQGIEGNRGLAREVKGIRCFKEWGESGGAYIIKAKKSAFQSKKSYKKVFLSGSSQSDWQEKSWLEKSFRKKQFTIYRLNWWSNSGGWVVNEWKVRKLFLVWTTCPGPTHREGGMEMCSFEYLLLKNFWRFSLNLSPAQVLQSQVLRLTCYLKSK